MYVRLETNIRRYKYYIVLHSMAEYIVGVVSYRRYAIHPSVTFFCKSANTSTVT